MLKHPLVFYCRGCLSRGLLLDSRARGQNSVDRHLCPKVAELTADVVTICSLTPLQLETRFGGQNYLDLVRGGVRGL